ncbi:hypothetical protein ACJX0J_024052 [Zea mays]
MSPFYREIEGIIALLTFTDLQAGAQLGVVTGWYFMFVTNFVLWILAELAVVACDIPEGIKNTFQATWFALVNCLFMLNSPHSNALIAAAIWGKTISYYIQDHQYDDIQHLQALLSHYLTFFHLSH